MESNDNLEARTGGAWGAPLGSRRAAVSPKCARRTGAGLRARPSFTAPPDYIPQLSTWESWVPLHRHFPILLRRRSAFQPDLDEPDRRSRRAARL